MTNKFAKAILKEVNREAKKMNITEIPENFVVWKSEEKEDENGLFYTEEYTYGRIKELARLS